MRSYLLTIRDVADEEPDDSQGEAEKAKGASRVDVVTCLFFIARAGACGIRLGAPRRADHARVAYASHGAWCEPGWGVQHVDYAWGSGASVRRPDGSSFGSGLALPCLTLLGSRGQWRVVTQRGT